MDLFDQLHLLAEVSVLGRVPQRGQPHVANQHSVEWHIALKGAIVQVPLDVSPVPGRHLLFEVLNAPQGQLVLPK